MQKKQINYRDAAWLWLLVNFLMSYDSLENISIVVWCLFNSLFLS